MNQHKKLEEEQLLNETNVSLDGFPWQIIIIYLLFGFSWIIFSDRILAGVINNQELYISIQTYKGMIFVTLTAILLYFLVNKYYKKVSDLIKTVIYKNHDLIIYSEELVAISDELNERIFDLNRTMDELTLQKQFVSEIYNNSNTLIFAWNLKGEILEFNNRFSELLGYSDTDLIGKKWFEVFLPESERIIVAKLISEIKTQSSVTNFENKVKTKDNQVLTMMWNDVLMQNPKTNSPMVVSFGIDITAEKVNAQRAFELAYTDRLTQLGNRSVFEKKVTELIASDVAFSLYYLDIDNFRNINDYYGHRYGDLYLQEFSSRLKSNLDTCSLYRWCGDEFMIIDERVEEERIQEISAKLYAIISEPWHYEIIDYFATASIGVVSYPKDGHTLDELYKNVDISLHHSKSIGKSSVSIYQTEFLKQFEERIEIERTIHAALLEEAFVLNFQPIYRLDTSTVQAVEVLIRWKDPSIHIPAGHWISIAEETEQILKVDQWVIKTAFDFIRSNLTQSDVITTINISSKTLLSDDFIPFLITNLALYEVNPSQVEFELTEHSLIDDLELSVRLVTSLKAIGFKIALDDFGTRYSSLNYLSHMPFDTLKIDKSYVDHIISSNESYIIVAQIVQLCKQLGIRTVAEGIETEDQSVSLKNIGCDYGQGYLFSRPVTQDKIVSILKNA